MLYQERVSRGGERAAEESDAQGLEAAGVAHHEAEGAADDDGGERVHARDARRGLDRLAEGDDEDGVEVAEVGPLVRHAPPQSCDRPDSLSLEVPSEVEEHGDEDGCPDAAILEELRDMRGMSIWQCGQCAMGDSRGRAREGAWPSSPR